MRGLIKDFGQQKFRFQIKFSVQKKCWVQKTFGSEKNGWSEKHLHIKYESPSRPRTLIRFWLHPTREG